MSRQVWTMAEGIVVERLGEEWLALDGDRVIRLVGAAADVVTSVMEGREVPSHLSDSLSELRALNILAKRESPSETTDQERALVSRRRAVSLLSVSAAVGASAMALPLAAAASSLVGEGGSGTPGDTTPSTAAVTTTTTVAVNPQLGSQWVTATTDVMVASRATRYDGNAFVSVGLASTAGFTGMRSVDGGKNWSGLLIGSTGLSFSSLAYGSEKWIAAPSNSSSYYYSSTDGGVNWTLEYYNTDFSGLGGTITSLGFGNNTFVGVMRTGTKRVFRSTDGGTVWSTIDVPENNDWESVAYGGGVWIAVSSNGTNRAMRSSDNGQTWSAVSIPTSSWSSVAFADGVWLAVASGGTQRVIRSTDGGQSWLAVTTPVVQSWRAVGAGGGVWVVVGTDGDKRVLRSSDSGVSWTAESAPVGTDLAWWTVAYGGGRFVSAAGNLGTSGDHRIMISPDAV